MFGRGILATLALLGVLVVDFTHARSRNCQEKALEVREEEANVMITGTIKELYPDRDHPNMFKGQVEIKRVFKGDNLISAMPGVSGGRYRDRYDDHNQQSRHPNSIPGFENLKKKVMVDGFGDPHICDSDVRKYDTRIFLLSKGRNGELRLNSSLIRLTLNNLEEADAAVKDIPFTAKPTPVVAPCETKYCAFGANCEVNRRTDEAECKCLEKCNDIFAPVCGNDGVTYTSECHLRVASCSKQKRIKVQFQGSCDVKDPCRKKDCSFGAHCVPSLDGLTARCQCPDRCDKYGDSAGSTPACGNDGKDYANVCEMERAACRDMKEIAMKYPGKCDPCDGFPCPRSQVCQLGENRKAVCRCNSFCTNEFAPVCGSDGHTYSNECQMRTEACKKRKDMRVQFHGECSTGNNPCSNKSCGIGEECHIDRSGQARCTCPPPCEHVMRPVCGSDGFTYDNDCELTRTACLRQKHVTVNFIGECSDDGPCSHFRCNFGALCVVRHNEPVCDCPTCSQEFQPVCASDGISYENECKLKAESCEWQRNIDVAYQGLCNGCKDKKCDHYAICESVGKGNAQCVCPSSCVQVEDQVCGTDGVTYQNECELRVASCRLKQYIIIASHGRCDLCENIKCHFGARCESGKCVCPQSCSDVNEPVCANDGMTYTNECEMRRQACSQGMELEVEHAGECEDMIDLSGSGDDGSGMDVCDETTCRYGGMCDYDAEGSTSCVCNFNCEAIRSPVCGSDEKTYGNECQMREESCKKQREITSQSMDNCEDIDEELCDGADAMVNPLTGLEYNCDNGRDTCPAGSYCHKLAGEAKCCKEDQAIRSCSDTIYGCCPDGKTTAPGTNNAGCPSMCHCHSLGSYRQTCDPTKRQCTCKPGVGGRRCDRCDPGFWGLPRIAHGNTGCIPCGCNIFGSVRDDCEQMTGRCVCKPGSLGQKCNMCPNGREIGPQGCSDSTAPVTSCRDLFCRFGGKCQINNRIAECKCETKCALDEPPVSVCGTDGQTYGSECQLKLFACRLQKELSVAYQGSCQAPSAGTTSLPGSRSRKTTRHISGKVTRHIIPPTPSGPEYGYVGDFCVMDKDCLVDHSYCKSGLCSCQNGFTVSSDNFACKALRALTDACASRPCQNGGLCDNDAQFGFRCICLLGFGGRLCELEAPSLLSSTLSDQGELFGFNSDSPFISENEQNVLKKEESFIVPSFAGKSYLEFKKLHGANREITVEISFKTLNQDGILLYSGQSDDGKGDFISLAIRDRHVEFRYDLGSGPVVLTTPETVSLNSFHKVVTRRFGQYGTVKLDEGIEESGTSPGALKSLNLGTSLYLGYVPEAAREVFTNVGTEMGLVGCVESLMVQTKDLPKEYDLMYPGSRKDIITGRGIGECGQNPCVSLPCQNGGTCMKVDDENFECSCLAGYKGLMCDMEESQPCNPNPCQGGGSCVYLPDGNFVCRCPPGRVGDSCEGGIASDISVPQFNGNSFIEMKLTKKVARTMLFEVWFFATKPNGVIIYGSQPDTNTGDFISLNLVDGFLQFRFDLGSGIANITTPSRIPLNVWHRVAIGRTNRHGTMIVNGDTPIRSHSKGSLKELNLGPTIYLGGFPAEVNSNSRVRTGLTGAIQRVYEDGQLVENLIGTAVLVVDVTQYEGVPCPGKNNPCRNGGECIPALNEYECKCPAEYTGKRCDKGSGGRRSRRLREGAVSGKSRRNKNALKKVIGSIDMNRPILFDGRSFHKYHNEITIKQKSQKTNRYEIKFRTTALNGLILLENKAATVQGDYLAIALNAGRIEVSYNLGKQSSEEGLHVITSDVRVNDGEWHTVEFKREKRKGELKVDDGTAVIDVSAHGATQLDTDGNLWLGGTRHLPAGLPSEYTVGFRGCIQEVRIDNKSLDLVENLTSQGSVEYCDA